MPREIEIAGDGRCVNATLNAAPTSRALVIFAHGSGSSRHSPRNIYVADILNARGIATLLVDLLTQDEEELDRSTASLRFDIALLARRVELATEWAQREPALQSLPRGYFGASTGAAAALLAASARTDVAAVVSRGGRPDLAGAALRNVSSPTLLIVGGNDPVVLRLNEQAQREIHAVCELAVIPGATHLFEEPGALEAVAAKAAEWFDRYL
ncbi:MAG TPA: alpha/beta hydrolase [Candidatus Baltobacteraceae bacterium]|jgi:dienelactone hydrolase|nr:alpha/beta hydrolase [Candidatus Baltobacteraceae bacterium]